MGLEPQHAVHDPNEAIARCGAVVRDELHFLTRNDEEGFLTNSGLHSSDVLATTFGKLGVDVHTLGVNTTTDGAVQHRTSESAYVASASADADTNDDGKLNFSGSSMATQVHLILPIGIGSLKFDVETVSNDLDPTLTATGESTEDQMFIGTLLQISGLRVGFNQGVQEIGSSEKTQSNLTAHYRFGITKGFWVGPEVQQQTIEVSGPSAAGLVDEEITSVAFLMSTRF